MTTQPAPSSPLLAAHLLQGSTVSLTPYHRDDLVTLYHGDCIEVMRALPDSSVDAVVTDPPYGLEFMGKEWDAPWKGDGDVVDDPASVGGFQDGNGGNPYSRSRIRYGREGDSMLGFQSWCTEWATEALRVLKPGGHLLAFGGTRTYHRLACAIEDAGFEVRDSIAWMYGSGFPKSLDVSKAIDKAAGATREVVGVDPRYVGMSDKAKRALGSVVHDGTGGTGFSGDPSLITAPATPEAKTWQGWGTALKPAFEPIVVARKPLIGTVAANVLAHGTGALNVDGCRIGTEGGGTNCTNRDSDGNCNGHDNAGRSTSGETVHGPETSGGRWPANVILDESQARALDAMSGDNVGNNGQSVLPGGRNKFGDVYGREYITDEMPGRPRDKGGASRFFYTAKADSSERPSYVREGNQTGRVTGLGGKVRQCNVCETRAIESGATEPSCGHGDYRWEEPTNETPGRVAHPTVKPLTLMRYLVRLVTPPGGVVLEPFAGSGTTLEACIVEGFSCIGIEREADYIPLIMQRITKPIEVTLL